ncbi:DUF2334 domain-containing protein [Rhodococcus sp. IEGM 1408]|uniref:DUF2334 domain-containing protein n=1 Tax=Rhodococcus sp. IEGM 1408 TaxID=3082220 RepID=UPI002954EF01|nr:DUF2334 domain-containing protein [Rhodococcus sp. IEGM 1408]MDV8002422.1 DUF2334 domain-containing protein [Rhodococcus sp. IEGM 1408]
MTPRLIVSLSGLRDSSLDNAVDLVGELERRSVPVSLLVAPRRGHEYRLATDEGSQEWFRHRRRRGDAIVLAGYDEAATRPRRPEFASIGPAEAAVRLAAADRLMGDMGLRTRVFAPPRWNASPGCLTALPGAGFRVCASLAGVHDVVRGTTERGRVLSIGEGFVADAWWCRALVTAAGRTAAAGGLVRINVSAKQLSRRAPRSALLDAVDRVTGEHGADVARYEWPPVALVGAA